MHAIAEDDDVEGGEGVVTVEDVDGDVIEEVLELEEVVEGEVIEEELEEDVEGGVVIAAAPAGAVVVVVVLEVGCL